jgi:hypothetical protein
VIPGTVAAPAVGGTVARRLGLTLAAGFVGLAGALALAAPAWAHGGEAPDGTNYRTEVTGVTPAAPGLAVRAVEAGARLELTNRTGGTIEVLGYQGEPYLEVRPDGVYENTHSPATYLNRTLAGDTDLPATADPTLPPSWQRIADSPVVRWHDQRTHWLEAAPPAPVRADPDRQHRVRDWAVPLRAGTSTMEVRGTLDWLPPPNPILWWAVSLLGALVVGTLGLLPAPVAEGRARGNTRAGRAAMPALTALCAAGGLAAIAFALAREADAGATGVAGVLQGLLTGQIWLVLTGLGALAAAAYALAGRAARDFALALAGGCLALFAGVTNAAVFSRSVAPVPWPATLARVLIALVIVAGAGVAVAGALRLRAAGRSTPLAAPPSRPSAMPPTAPSTNGPTSSVL